MNNYTIFTDGAFSSSRQQGGSSFIILKDGEKISEWFKGWKGGTNNTAEILAILMAVKSIVGKDLGKITIYTDSQYCIGCASLGWKRKKNIKLWEIFDKYYNDLLSRCESIEFIHVDGHKKDDSFLTKWNNYVDRLAVLASHEPL